MGKVKGFLEYDRRGPQKEPPQERTRHFREFEILPSESALREQGARCMNCGIPFCHNGCPLGNEIPDWNDLVYKGRWERALTRLHATNNFPEFTGRVCPAPCETSCVLNINDDAVAIKNIEQAIADRGFAEGWVRPIQPVERSHKRVAVVGSGPAGLACAQQLARAGHDVVVYERAERFGGLLRYGIPDFKLEKHHIDRRLDQMRAEGVRFVAGVDVGRDITAGALLAEADAICLATGATLPRELPLPGRPLLGIHFAMEYLTGQNQAVAGELAAAPINVADKRVVVLGGGDTGSDCVGTANRQGAASVTQIELLPKPPSSRTAEMPWPKWPLILRTSSSHEEGAEREFGILTERFVEGPPGRLGAIEATRLEWHRGEGGERTWSTIPGSNFQIPCDIAFLALGFTGPEPHPLYTHLGVPLSQSGLLEAHAADYRTAVPGIFACGDARRGQSLVVWAIWEGREAARCIDAWLRGKPLLPSRPAPLLI